MWPRAWNATNAGSKVREDRVVVAVAVGIANPYPNLETL